MYVLLSNYEIVYLTLIIAHLYIALCTSYFIEILN